MSPDAQQLIQLIRQWGSAKELNDPKLVFPQLAKLTEEVGELASAINKKQHAAISDELGDCVVVLIILAAQHGFLLEHCLETAYKKIKDRTGKIVDGVFVKEADL